MASFNTVCLSGQNPVPLANSAVCKLGFLCSNNSAENPPVYCPPTLLCQIVRAQFSFNSCPVPQGFHEPILCRPGFYCPEGGREQIRCPKNHYCPSGTYNPIQCMPLSICPEGSIREVPLVGLIALLAIYVILFLSIVGSKTWGFKKSSNGGKVNLGCVASASGSGETMKSPEEEIENGRSAQYRDPQTSNIFGPLMECRSMDELGIEFNFRDLGYEVKNVARPVLQGLSGRIRKGCVMGVVGQSGSGKSTLLNILAGRIRQTSGSTAVNGIEGGFTRFKYLVGFVPQDDILLEDLTVHESILHSARIKLGGIWSDHEINSHVDRLISYLGLSAVRNLRVGGVEERGISGGERKRVNIALELVAMPMAIVLDEPTSGLDASTALSITKLLESVSDLGVTVVCAIHQPRKDIFELFDDILLLVSGQQVYMGLASEIQEHFERIGYSFPMGCNPADVIMDIVSHWQPRSELIRHPVLSKHLGETSATSTDTSTRATTALMKLVKSIRGQAAPWYRQLVLYFLCGIRQQSRRRFSLILEMVTGSVTGLLIGLSVNERKGHLFQGIFQHPFELLSSAVDYITIPLLGFISCLAVTISAAPAGIKTISEEKLVFYRDARAGHSSSAYFLGKDLSTWPRIFISSLHFTTFYMILATPVVSFRVMLLLNAVYFFCIYGVASLVASLVRRQDAPLLAMFASLVVSILDGFGPRMALVRSWNLAWLWNFCPGTWYLEAFFNVNTLKFAYLYDMNMALGVLGYVTNRTSFDIGLLVVIGVVYRIIAYVLLILTNITLPSARKLLKERVATGAGVVQPDIRA